jgi:LysR family glycine cleavage system transcriptional activator
MHTEILHHAAKDTAMTQPRKRLPLTALRSFEAAARLLSFKGAAEELSVSATTVSNQIRQLERDWNTQLFLRKTRRVDLTEAGRSLAQVVSRAFDDIRAEMDSHVLTPRKTVTLAVGPIFAARWLIPRLGRFRKLHPEIELVLQHGPRIAGVADMTSMISVDWGTGQWLGLDARKLLEITYSPVLSPALADQLGGLATPADLSRYPILHHHDRSEWTAWRALAGLPEGEFGEETVIMDSNVALQAARDGLGVALGIFPLIDEDVATGRLLRPFEIALHPTRSYHLLTRTGAALTPEIRATCDWIEAEARLMG